MTRFRRFFIGGLLILATLDMVQISAQETTSQTTGKGSLEEQFNVLKENASRYQEFRLIKETSWATLKSNVLDSVRKMKGSMASSQELIGKHKATTDSLKSLLQDADNKIDETLKAKNSMNLFGISLEKDIYVNIIWTLISLLLIGVITFFILFKRSNKITIQSRSNLEETRLEFEKFRKRALEREQELSRNHLAELNKYKRQSSGS